MIRRAGSPWWPCWLGLGVGAAGLWPSPAAAAPEEASVQAEDAAAPDKERPQLTTLPPLIPPHLHHFQLTLQDPESETGDPPFHIVLDEKRFVLALGAVYSPQYSYFRDTNRDGTTINNNFEVLRAEFRLRAEMGKYVGAYISVDPRQGVGLLDAFVTLRILPHHQVWVGQQVSFFGYENYIPAGRSWVNSRSHVVTALGRGPTARDIGVGLLGDWSLGRHFGIDYQFSVMNGAGRNNVETTERKNYWGRVGLSAHGRKLWLRAGGSGGRGDTLNVPPFTRAAADVQIGNSWFVATGEYIWSRQDADPARLDPATNKPANNPAIGQGLSVLLVGKTPWRFGPLVRYDAFEESNLVQLDRNFRYTFGAYWAIPKLSSTLLVNYDWDRSDISENPLRPQTAVDDMLSVRLDTRF